MRNPFFAPPAHDDSPTLMNTVQDAIGGVVIVACIIVALHWAPELSALFVGLIKGMPGL